MPDMIAITQGVNAAKALTDIVKTMVGLRDSAKLLEATVEFNQQLLAVQKALLGAQEEQTALIKTINDQEKEIARLKAGDAEKKKYDLKDVGHGAFAYVRKDTATPREVTHWLCTNCYTKGIKSMLLRVRGGPIYADWGCPACAAKITVGVRVSPSNPSSILPVL